MNRSWLRRLGCACAGLALFALFAVLPATPASATATGAVSSTLHFEVVEVQDDMGNPIAMAPAGFSLSVSAAPVNEEPSGTNSGPGGVTFGGSAVASGIGQSSVIDLINDLSCTADPGGNYAAFQDAFGQINVENTSGQTIVLIVQFDTGSSLSASTTLVGETASATITSNWLIPPGTTLADVNCPGADLTSPNNPLFDNAGVTAPGMVSNPISSCILALTVPTGTASSSSFPIIITACAASSPAIVPSSPPAGLAAFALLLLVAGWFVLRRTSLAG